MGNSRAREHLIASLRATLGTVRTQWKGFVLPEVALAFGYWCVRNRPDPNPMEGIEALLVAAAVLVACTYVCHGAIAPVGKRVQFEWRKRQAYRALWRVDGDMEKVVKDATATAFTYNGKHMTVRDILLFIARNTDHATYQAIENYVVGQCKPPDPKENKRVTGSAANLFLVLKHNDMLFIHKDDSTGNSGPYMMEPNALRLLENLRVGEVLREFGPPSRWT